jgi:glycosyltransferase involved in cell wall biosynthesis
VKTIQITNLHRFRGGTDVLAEENAGLLTRRGHNSVFLTRDSRQLGRGIAGKARAFGSGIYSASGRQIVAKALRQHRPDLVHIHEVYPFFSPWILRDCRHAGVPVVMTCHDYRLTCPIAVHMREGMMCELCLGGKEHRCFLKNCRNSRLESLAYALRSVVARKWRLFLDNVTVYTTPSEFVKRRLVNAGFPRERIVTMPPYMAPVPDSTGDVSSNEYVAYVGRITPEKGIETLLASARITELRVRIVGDYSQMPHAVMTAPPNVEFLGTLGHNELGQVYKHARFLVLPSIWIEAFGRVAPEAMGYGLPVVASNVGGIPEVVEDGVTGLLFEPGNPDDLARKMTQLWQDPGLCRQMGQAGRQKLIREYSEDAYYERLMAVYEDAVKRGPRHGRR